MIAILPTRCRGEIRLKVCLKILERGGVILDQPQLNRPKHSRALPEFETAQRFRLLR